MKLTIEPPDGEPFEFECEDTLVSAWVSQSILKNETYPIMPFIDDVSVVFDAGGNCGAAAVHFARHYPDAVIHTFEPGSHQRSFLTKNAAAHPKIDIHPIALHSYDGELPLFQGNSDSGMSSLVASEWATESHESVPVRSAGGWVKEAGLDHIDVMKLDVEGCEVDVLESLCDILPTVRVLYVEYDSRQARRDIDRLLADTHELYAGKVFLDQGEVVYLSKAVANADAPTEHLRTLFVPDE
ncbi:MAG: FkbM family methyltransferase [Candidatus Aldehydirespiratoraceae bacterium]|jgi:FkbM family methyltransferase